MTKKDRTAKLEIRCESDNDLLLESVKDQLEEVWPLAFVSEITQNERNPRMGWFRVYLNLSLAIPEEGDRNG